MMADTSSSSPKQAEAGSSASIFCGLWLWFVAGFIIVFAGMLLGVRMYSVLPSGQAVVERPLWQRSRVRLRRMSTDEMPSADFYASLSMMPVRHTVALVGHM